MRLFHSFARLFLGVGTAALLACIAPAHQSPPPENPSPRDQNQAVPGAPAPLQLTLKDALERAEHNDPAYQATVTEAAVARQTRNQARDALLPKVDYDNSYIYTQSDQRGGFRFIANNAVHEYLSQANVHETIGLAEIANFRGVSAAAAVARAKAEIAQRGLVVTVVQAYFAVAAAQEKLATEQQAALEGQRFLKITQDLENGGEVAHSDVIKAELQVQDRNRQLQEAQLALLNARLNLAVLVFPNFNTDFQVADNLHADVLLPPYEEVQQLAGRNNPDVAAALAAVQQASREVTVERAGYLPSLSLDYFYGIDAANFAVNSPDGRRNLGYSAMATVNIPVWNWGATQSRVKQAELRRTQAKRELSFAQRKLLAELQSLFTEAQTARQELAGLERAASLAQESLRLVTLRYKDGESTVLEVVDAQTVYATANAAYQDGAVRYRVALANLQTLTGVLPQP